MRSIVVTQRITIAGSELQFSFVHSAGPGGQNVNKRCSKAVLHWDVMQSASLPDDVKLRFLDRYARRINRNGHFFLSSDRHREQARNVADCGRKLRELVLAVLNPPKTRIKTGPPRTSVERRLRQKKHRSQQKQTRRFRPDDE